MQHAAMRLTLAQPAGCRCVAPRTTRAHRAPMVVRSQRGDGQGPAAAAAAAMQVGAVAQAVSDAAPKQQQQDVYDEVAVVVSHAADSALGVSAEPKAHRAAPQPAAPGPRGTGGMPFGLSLEHPAVKVAGIGAAVFLGGTLLLTLFRMSKDPTKKRSKTINKNKAVIDTIAKYLPGNRAGLSSGAFTLLKLQTGFSNVEVFRKYLWFLLRERQFDEEALGDLVALKAALGLTDEEVAEALAERAARVYEKYGTVMVNLEGFSQGGIERQASARNLFIKLLSLSESRPLLSAEAGTKVDLCKIFGVTQRDMLTLRSGYSAEAESGEREGGEDGEE